MAGHARGAAAALIGRLEASAARQIGAQRPRTFLPGHAQLCVPVRPVGQLLAAQQVAAEEVVVVACPSHADAGVQGDGRHNTPAQLGLSAPDLHAGHVGEVGGAGAREHGLLVVLDGGVEHRGGQFEPKVAAAQVHAGLQRARALWAVGDGVCRAATEGRGVGVQVHAARPPASGPVGVDGGVAVEAPVQAQLGQGTRGRQRSVEAWGSESDIAVHTRAVGLLTAQPGRQAQLVAQEAQGGLAEQGLVAAVAGGVIETKAPACRNAEGRIAVGPDAIGEHLNRLLAARGTHHPADTGHAGTLDAQLVVPVGGVVGRVGDQLP